MCRTQVLPTIHSVVKSLVSRKPVSIFLLPSSTPCSRYFSLTSRHPEAKDDKYYDASTAAEPGASGDHEGSASRTCQQISFQNPDEQRLPGSHVVQGRGGVHMTRTLASFSLEGRVAVITGGAQGLGLVMGRALVQSGADLAIVDLNGTMGF